MIPEKIVAPYYIHPEGRWEIQEAFRFKDRETLKTALLEEMQRLYNEGCYKIHCFMISTAWLDIRGTRREDVYYNCDWAAYGSDKIECYKDGERTVIEDDRPHAGHVRNFAGTGSRIFEFAGLPVYLMPISKSINKIVLAIPG